MFNSLQVGRECHRHGPSSLFAAVSSKPSSTRRQLCLNTSSRLRLPHSPSHKSAWPDLLKLTNMATQAPKRQLRNLLKNAGRNTSVRRMHIPTTPRLTQQSRRNGALSSTAQWSFVRPFSASPIRSAGIMPDHEDPPPKESEPTHHISEPTPLSEQEYHEHADRYIDQVIARLEEIQESREDVEVEHAVSNIVGQVNPPADLWDHRPVFSLRHTLPTEPTSSISNQPTSRYGSAPQYLDPRGTTGWSRVKIWGTKRAVVLVNGSICGT